MKPKLFKSFDLFNHSYKVYYVRKITQAEDVLGLCNTIKGEIYLATHLENKKLTQDQLNITKWHETVHAILDELGYHELSANEQFVDCVAKCLAQIEKTSK